MRKYKSKRIYLNEENSKWCIVKLFANKRDMQNAYKKFMPEDTDHYYCEGAHCGYTKINMEGEKVSHVSNETGTVFLHFGQCGAGIVSHELLHAVLWAHGHSEAKEQYPIVINNMMEEEIILHNHTDAVTQFYKWYWKVESQFKVIYLTSIF